ncbi:hypothetical protein PoB_000975100 [Plakobranchus ocellatus]|uniref:Uncharacterized protein n=1 Tax=Plakobranchus ocellatus TaxID=259542 RepID=A0AAV3YLH4_9GAST|nr:hypothetical protein PoB_000975100 [Plakobranchus ocellatus]
MLSSLLKLKFYEAHSPPLQRYLWAHQGRKEQFVQRLSTEQRHRKDSTSGRRMIPRLSVRGTSRDDFPSRSLAKPQHRCTLSSYRLVQKPWTQRAFADSPKRTASSAGHSNPSRSGQAVGGTGHSVRGQQGKQVTLARGYDL